MGAVQLRGEHCDRGPAGHGCTQDGRWTVNLPGWSAGAIVIVEARVPWAHSACSSSVAGGSGVISSTEHAPPDQVQRRGARIGREPYGGVPEVAEPRDGDSLRPPATSVGQRLS